MPDIAFDKLFESSPNAYTLLDREFRYVAANKAYLRVTASRWEDLVGRRIFDVFPDEPAAGTRHGADMLRDSLRRAFTEGRPDMLALMPYRVPRTTSRGVVNEERYWSATHTPIFDDAGGVAYVLQHSVDVTEMHRLKQAARTAQPVGGPSQPENQLEADLLQRARQVQAANRDLDSERRHLRRLFEQAPGFIAIVRGRDHVFELTNAAYNQLVGHREIIGKPVLQALPEIAGQGFTELLDRVTADGEPFVGRGIRVLLQRRPGAPLDEVFVEFIFQPVFGPDGAVSAIFIQGSDVTEQVRAQRQLQHYRDHLEELVRERTRALQESEAERRQAEDALRQAQKMEAVGRLTGGIAHDFNNLLQVVAGNLELLQRDVGDDARARRRVGNAIAAVERGARLASQLLAFARRQPLQPVAVNLGRLLSGMDDMLRRALGEHVELQTTIADGLWNTLADPNQVENVILNLAINSCDAMDGQGKLTVEALNASLDEHYAARHAEVTPGQYVTLAVSDTGCGMSPELIERAFEPFFTTKPDGTGLGLSMVYGFVKQSGGHIKVYSEPGHGTTIRMYFPRCLQAEEIVREPVSGPVEGGTETILVVEDDAQVRASVVEVLGELGYRVLEAADGESALAIIQADSPVDLLFTDVVMPGPLRGPELANRARAVMPELEVLFTSGYTDNAILHGGQLAPGFTLLSKPYRRESLARKIRLLLGDRRQRPAGAAAPPEPAPAAAKASLRILLVEDEEGIREAAAELMKDLGHRVVAFDNAEAAVGALAEGEFDLLFTDHALPGMSGVELARHARRLRPGLRVVLSSGYGQAVAGGEAGDDYLYLAKPFDLARLERLLASLVADPTGG